jgi:hypothetical protein
LVEALRAGAVAQLPATIGLSLTPASRIGGIYNSRTAEPIDSRFDRRLTFPANRRGIPSDTRHRRGRWRATWSPSLPLV